MPIVFSIFSSWSPLLCFWRSCFSNDVSSLLQCVSLFLLSRMLTGMLPNIIGYGYLYLTSRMDFRCIVAIRNQCQYLHHMLPSAERNVVCLLCLRVTCHRMHPCSDFSMSPGEDQGALHCWDVFLIVFGGCFLLWINRLICHNLHNLPIRAVFSTEYPWGYPSVERPVVAAGIDVWGTLDRNTEATFSLVKGAEDPCRSWCCNIAIIKQVVIVMIFKTLYSRLQNNSVIRTLWYTSSSRVRSIAASLSSFFISELKIQLMNSLSER